MISSDIEFGPMEFADASELDLALSDAIDAMAHYGTAASHMEYIAMLLVATKRAKSFAYKVREREASAGAKPKAVGAPTSPPPPKPIR